MSTPFNDLTDADTGRQRPGPVMLVAFEGWNGKLLQIFSPTGPPRTV